MGKEKLDTFLEDIEKRTELQESFMGQIENVVEKNPRIIETLPRTYILNAFTTLADEIDTEIENIWDDEEVVSYVKDLFQDIVDNFDKWKRG